MALSLRVIPGYQFAENERLTQTKLNQLGRPTIELQGALAASAIAPGSITPDKLSPDFISGLTAADPEKVDLVMFHDVSANALRNTTFDKILALSTPNLTTITAVAFTDYGWIIQGGANKQATVGDILRESVNGQTELTTTTEIDPAADMLLVYDASATDNTNKNRKAKIRNAVQVVTQTLIADTPALGATETLDPANDELLLRDASASSPTQQVRVKLKDIAAQVGGIKAWCNFNGKIAVNSVANTFDAANDVITTQSPHGLNSGDWIWFTTGGNGVSAYTSYYVATLTSTLIQLYTTQAGALAQNPAFRVDLTGNSTNQSFQKWASNPIRRAANLTAVIRTSAGFYRAFFETPQATADYGVLIGAAEVNSQDGIIGFVDLSVALTVTGFAFQTKDDDGGNADSQMITLTVVS